MGSVFGFCFPVRLVYAPSLFVEKSLACNAWESALALSARSGVLVCLLAGLDRLLSPCPSLTRDPGALLCLHQPSMDRPQNGQGRHGPYPTSITRTIW